MFLTSRDHMRANLDTNIATQITPLLVGEYNRSTDEKGRIAIPKELFKTFAKQKFCYIKIVDERVEIYPGTFRPPSKEMSSYFIKEFDHQHRINLGHAFSSTIVSITGEGEYCTIHKQ